jgi:perosamine synthetase
MRFKLYNSIGQEEIYAANKVLKSGFLSKFVAGNFDGGHFVKKFEKYLAKFYKVKHAITLNSWTSGLIACVGALKINPGDEIITTPWSMCASATAILHWNAIPIFVDIDKDSFCIDPKKIKEKITKKTVAIIAVDIFGRSSDYDEIRKVIKGTKIMLITDSAQSPYSFYKNKLTGTQSDIGGFSLNYHKHINTGEGGVIVTNNDLLAKRVKMIRNHAEVFKKNRTNYQLSNMIGYNFRMGEIEAAIGIEQYKKLKRIILRRNLLINHLNKNLSKLKGLIVPVLPKGSTHNYYVYPLVLDKEKISISRKIIVKNLKLLGVKGLIEGYSNIHLLPMYQKKIAYGEKGFPWSYFNNKVTYKKGICPIAEEMHEKFFFGIEVCLFNLGKKEINFIINSFYKTWNKLKI